jgi:hypothetical protein
MKRKKKMDAKWCTYSWYNKNCPQHIGKLLKIDESGCGIIKYSEKQLYAPAYWDMNYVAVFGTLEDTIRFMLENSKMDLFDIKDDIMNSFKDDANKINWNDI